MKKMLLSLCLFGLILIGTSVVSAITFSDGIQQSKPMALFLYADWADNVQSGMQAFKLMEQKYSKKYNFVTLNIADNDAKTFNSMYHIYPNLPYVLLFRDGTKFSRYLNMNCVLDASCFSGKLDNFVN